ncbi:MAG: hypothetical protein HC933_01590 [Pleurocapsa sp. SU_196_0]|nr:hypothetical protein [Pleurocapsa sp. SU_196_0]
MFLFTLIFALASCAPSSSGPAEAVKKNLDALKNFDLPALEQLSGGKGNPFEKMPTAVVEMFKNVFSKLEYTLGTATVNGDEATVQASITSIELQSVLKAAMPQVMKLEGEQDANKKAALKAKIISELVNDPSVSRKTSDVTVRLQKKGDGWQIAQNRQHRVQPSHPGQRELTPLEREQGESYVRKNLQIHPVLSGK